ncbi:MAG: nitrogenase cofactor biosynthesis protein NifB [Methanosarcinales archaeon]|nr:nitrogenase cofactor biosynthesis protein NifB [Methanosarcinales archaeon]
MPDIPQPIQLSPCPSKTDIDDETDVRRIKEHPCYDQKAQHKFGRIHLPVAPKCNVQCNFCVRKFDCVNESRPGVTSEVLTPEEAIDKLREVVTEHPFIKVAGIAGPGDPLANDETFETFRLIKKEFPDMMLCLSTNGLALPQRIPEIKELGVSHLTVTINAVDPEIIAKIYSHINYNGEIIKGIEAARILHENQINGLKAAIAENILVKVNTVLIPGINDHHIEEIAKTVSGLGAFIMNVMPLIAQGKFADITPPTHEERAEIQKRCAPYVKQMRHCRQCRADAYGLIGKDMSQGQAGCKIKQLRKKD